MRILTNLFKVAAGLSLAIALCCHNTASAEEVKKHPVECDSYGLTVCITTPSAGTVGEQLSEYTCRNITSLLITGHIDARDFNFIKWNCINVQYIDLSGTVIDAYSGRDGTNEGYMFDYDADEIPLGAFFYWISHAENHNGSMVFVDNGTGYYDEGMPSLKSVKLPQGIRAIRRNAFARAYNLTDINIPEGVESVDLVAFRYCTSLSEITLPSSLKEIGLLAFTSMYSLRTVHCRAAMPPVTNKSFGVICDSTDRGRVEVNSYSTDDKVENLYVPKGSRKAYVDAGWLDYFLEISEE